MNRYFSLIFFGYLLNGCAPSTITKQDFAPKMYKELPRSILVLPPINKSTAADAKEYYLSTVAPPLTNSGYYVFPIEFVSDVLKQEGLSDTETMMNIPPQKFREFFGADAVMYISILKWNTNYLLVAGSVTVQIECELKSSISGESLWYYNEEMEVNTTGEQNKQGGLAGVLLQAVETAVKTAATDYVPIARNVNTKIFLTLPYGKYRPEHNADGNQIIQQKSRVIKKY